jgi:hypothetical protein
MRKHDVATANETSVRHTYIHTIALRLIRSKPNVGDLGDHFLPNRQYADSDLKPTDRHDKVLCLMFSKEYASI